MGDRLGTLGAVGNSFLLSFFNIKDHFERGQIKKPEYISLILMHPGCGNFSDTWANKKSQSTLACELMHSGLETFSFAETSKQN